LVNPTGDLLQTSLSSQKKAEKKKPMSRMSPFDLATLSLSLMVLGGLAVLSAFMLRNIPQLYIVDPEVALDAVRDQIQAELLELLQHRFGPDFVFPPGLSIETVGEHIYQGVTRLEDLQAIFLSIFEHGFASPHFETALTFIHNFM
jgi:hypothetical protein